jgi:uncharacterized membrane protein
MTIWNFNPASKLPGRSAFTPALWLCALLGIPSIAAATVAPWWIAVWLLTLTSIVTLGTFGVFAFHSVKNQHLLQSEDYLLRRDALTIFGSSSYQGEHIVQVINTLENKTLSDRSISNEYE